MEIWGCVTATGKLSEVPSAFKKAAALIPRMEKVWIFLFQLFSLLTCVLQAGNKLLSLANLNRTVHLPAYNRLIAEEACSCRRSSRAKLVNSDSNGCLTQRQFL